MDAKLKALKVADLKAVLAKAQVQAPAKATKADLIARILESQPAQDAYAQIYEPEQDASEPAAEVEEEEPEPAAEVEAETPAEPAPSAPVDPELEARRKRAERFGIPLVEPKAKPARKERPAKGAAKAAPSSDVSAHSYMLLHVLYSHQDTKKLNERAERFGLKRSAPAETVDPEEAERRKKRAERFGVQVGFHSATVSFVHSQALLAQADS
jgi:SAP domain-containing ribonucleoprotein